MRLTSPSHYSFQLKLGLAYVKNIMRVSVAGTVYIIFYRRVSKKAKKQPPASNVTPPNCDESSSDSDSESSGDVQDIAEGSDAQSGHAAGTSRQTPSNSNSELEAGPSEEHGNAEVTKLASRPITIQTA